MHRAQVLLEEWQYQRLRAHAERRGKSISAALRELLSTAFEREAAEAGGGLATIEGLVSDPKLRGEDHDAILYRQKRR